MQTTSGDQIQCPRCSGGDIRRSYREKPLDLIVQSFLMAKALRCRGCSKRFYRKVSSETFEARAAATASISLENQRYSVRW
jgi:phage FluMu protein Com